MRLIKATLITCCFFLAGCKEVLYSDLSEREANEMVAILESSGISASRTVDKDRRYDVSIAEGSLPAAIAILQRHGLPRPRFGSVGDVFDGQGIVGSTFEENARYAYALGQELSDTLSRIDGVSQARVHVVLHPKGRLDRESIPSTASVMIEHYPEFPIETAIADVKTLVTHAVPDLSIENVSVSLFQSAVPIISMPQGMAAEASAGGFLAGRGQGALPTGAMALLGGLFLIALGVAFMRDKNRGSRGD